MSGIAFSSFDDTHLREQLSSEIIRRRDFLSIGSDGFGTSSVPVSRGVCRFEAGRMSTSVNAVAASGTHQISVSTVDELGHVHTAPLVTRPFSHVSDDAHGFDLALLDLHCPSPSTGLLNHAFLCMDIGNCVISPRMVGFFNNHDAGGPSASFASVETIHVHSEVEVAAAPVECDSQPAIILTECSPPDVPYIDLGDCHQQCQHCGALFWYNERLRNNNYRGRAEYHLCCGGGGIYMPPAPDPPARIQELLSDRQYMDHIRAYNQMFAMTSFGAKVDESVNDGRGPYVFKVSGQIYHWIRSFCPEDGDQPRFLQLYIFDTQDEVNNRLRKFARVDGQHLSPQIVEDLIHVLDEYNELVRLFRTARDRCNGQEIPRFKIRLHNGGGAKCYDLPTSDSVGGIVFEDGPKSRTDFDVIIEARGGRPQRINKLHKSYMSLQYPLLFPFGRSGFHSNLMLKPKNNRGRGKKVSMNGYYKYQLHPRVQEFGLIFKSGHLFQQYVVTVFCAIEQSRLDHVRKRQNELRSDYLMGLYDVVSRGDRQGIDAGSIIMLPKTFTGGPRYMYSHYLDALAICKSLGNPQYFITFTCNVKWPEVQRYMEQYPGLTPTDRADIVCRLFQQKVNDFVRFLKEERPFGRVAGFLYTIEFQKRGLPHCHTLLWVDPECKIKEAAEIDSYISAELPDPVNDPAA